MATLAVQVSPRSNEDSILGWKTGAKGKAQLVVKLTAVPDSGKANEALIRLLAKELGLPKSSIGIKSGHTSRHKLLQINMEQSELDATLQHYQDSL